MTATKKTADTSNNLELWDKVCETPPSITKQVKYGSRKFTAIDAQKQLKRATELWGMYGVTWGVSDCDYVRYEFAAGNAVQYELALHAVFYYPGGSFEIGSDIKQVLDGDSHKKLLTDLMTKALSKLGFNSDIFEGKFDDNKYLADAKAKEAGKPQPKADPNDPARVISGAEAARLTNLIEEKRKAAGFTSASALDVAKAIRKDVLGDERCQTLKHLTMLCEAVESGNYDLDTGELIKT